MSKNSQNGKLIISSLDHFTVDWFTTFLVPLLPLVATEFSLQKGTAAFIAATMSVIAAFSQPVGAFLGEKFNTQMIEIVGILMVSIFMSSIGLAINIWMLVLFLILGNIGNALFHPNAAGYVGNMPFKKKHTAMSIFSIGGALGRASAPLVIVWYVTTFNMKNMYFIIVMGVVMAVLTSIYLFSDGKEINLKSKKRERFNLGRAFKVKGVTKLMLLILFKTLAMRSFFVLVPLYLVSIGFHVFVGGFFLTFSALAGVVGNYLGAFLADRIGPKNVNVISLFASIPFAFLFMIGGSTYFMLSMYTLMTFFASFSLAFNISYMQDFLPEHREVASSMAMGVPWGVAGIAFMGLSLLANYVGLHVVLYIGGFALLTSALIALGLPKIETKVQR